jgi:hypothetical protein
MPRSRKEDYTWWLAATGGTTVISDGGVRGSRRDRPRPGEGFNRMHESGYDTTRVAHKQRSIRPDSTSACSLAWLINAPAAARAGRVSWRIATFMFRILVYMHYLFTCMF